VIGNGKEKQDVYYHSTGESMFKEEFDKLYTSKALKDRRDNLIAVVDKATSIINQRPSISKTDFAYLMEEKGNYESVQGLLETLKTRANEKGQISTRNIIGTVITSLTEFKGKISLGDLDSNTLEKYEEWLIEKGLSYNTVGFYTREIRKMFRWAIDELQIIHPSKYPFGRRKFIPPASTARKIALNEAQKNLMMTYVAEDPFTQRSVDFWKLSYLLSGMNFKDILLLKWRNLVDEMGMRLILINREKTSDRKRDKTKIEIPVIDEAMEIIKKYSRPSLNPDAYLFETMDGVTTEEQIHNRKNRFIKFTNAHVKKACESMGIPVVTTYSARHTFAYIMKIKSVPIALRKEMMGHEDERTTAAYGGIHDMQQKLNTAKLLVG
jgi:integrase/recombinase XerD